MTKQDLTQYGDQELSCMVFNTESLYLNRNESYFIGSLKKLFIFSENQLEELLISLKEDQEEMEEYEKKYIN